jgi:ribosome-binding factor A
MDRIDRINETMKREISQLLQREFQDPRFMFVTITTVDVSRDLQQAVVSYSVLGDEKQRKDIGDALDRLKGYVRKMIGQRVRMRYTPEIKFVYDRSIEYSIRIEETLAEIKRDIPPKA